MRGINSFGTQWHNGNANGRGVHSFTLSDCVRFASIQKGARQCSRPIPVCSGQIWRLISYFVSNITKWYWAGAAPYISRLPLSDGARCFASGRSETYELRWKGYDCGLRFRARNESHSGVREKLKTFTGHVLHRITRAAPKKNIYIYSICQLSAWQHITKYIYLSCWLKKRALQGFYSEKYNENRENPCRLTVNVMLRSTLKWFQTKPEAPDQLCQWRDASFKAPAYFKLSDVMPESISVNVYCN